MTVHWQCNCSLPVLWVVLPKLNTPLNSAGTSSVASKYEELECLYAAVGKVIYEGLTNYEKATNANPSQLFGRCPTPLAALWECPWMRHVFVTNFLFYRSDLMQRKLWEAFQAKLGDELGMSCLWRKGMKGDLLCSVCFLSSWEQFLEVGICRSARWKPFLFQVHREKVQYWY